MRLILEKSEIVAILGKHFEANLDPEKVIIRTDPFEIEVCGLPLAEAQPVENNVVPLNAPPRKQRAAVVEETPSKPRDDPDASTDTPPPGDDGLGGPEADVHPAAVLAASKQLEVELDRENPQLKRRSGNFSHEAPADYKNEIS